MSKRVIKSVIYIILAAAVLSFYGAALAETLYVQRTQVDIKKGKGSFHPTIYTARQGEALEVSSRQGDWYQVQTPKGPGWVFKSALASKKPTDLGIFSGSTNTSELDKTAGFKGFDAPTEREYVSRNKLQQQMRLVDRMERPPFSVSELQRFQQEGRVGRGGGR